MAYTPRNVPVDPENVPNWLVEELALISAAFVNPEIAEFQQLKELNVEPAKPRTGMIVLADGTNWDPGSGAGFYGYRGGSWVLLG